MMENNKEEVLNQLENDEESSSKLEKDNRKKWFKISLKMLLIILAIAVVVIGVILIYFICENKSCTENNSNNVNKFLQDSKFDGIDYKPIIYLYPTEEKQVSVQLGYKEKII